MVSKLLRALDERLGVGRFTREALNKIFPDHWSFMLGEIAAYAFLMLVATGVYLTFFFEPSSREVVYDGSYGPLQGVPMTAAYESTVTLSHDIAAGLLIRQMHHWAALVFVGAIVAHAARIFFTGAFRKPRELNWLVGLTLALLAVATGFTGYSLPDDLLSGTGLRIAWSILISVPVVGSWLGFTLFGGEYPGDEIIGRLFVIHVLILPVAIAALLTLHLAMVWRQRHTQFSGAGRTEANVVGSRLWPTYALRSASLFAAVAAVLAALAGLVQINPVWLYGPYEPSAVTTAAQPDWYVGWLEGALRIMPAFQVELFGYRVPEAVVPGVILPVVALTLLYAWPFLERRVTRDRDSHELIARPRDHPVRTGLGVGGLTFGAVLMLAGGQDLYASWLAIPVTTVTVVLQVSLVTLPVVTGLVAWRICHELLVAEPRDEFADTGAGPVGPNEPRHGPGAGPDSGEAGEAAPTSADPAEPADSTSTASET